MWLKRFTTSLLHHRWRTLLLTFAITFVPVVGILGILIAALVTLVEGIATGALLTLAATLPYVISFYFTTNPNLAIPLVFWAAFLVAVLSNLLTWVFAVMLKRQASWSQIIQIAALAGVFVVSVVHLAYPNVADWWGTQLQLYLKQVPSVSGWTQSASSLPNESQLEAIQLTKQYATGLMVAAVLLNALVQLVVARWWQGAIFRLSLRHELHYIRLSPLAGVLFLVSLVLSYLGNKVVLDIMPILYILFTVAGLSLIHYLFAFLKTKTSWFWLTLMYALVLFSMPTSILLIAILALMDIWLDIRNRLKKI